MRVGIPRETTEGERRVALVPETVGKLAAAGFELVVEQGAGAAASFPDNAYTDAGAVSGDPWDADGVVKVRKPSPDERERLRPGQLLIAFLEPLSDPTGVEALAARGVTAFALESVPRITRAQSMDALSSQATVGGYKAALLGAEHLPRFFPMLMTAAGTVPPAKVLVIGAGVAGLQALATARRLGAVVTGFDVRPAVREQIESLGASWLDLGVTGAEAEGGYARELTPEEMQAQQRARARLDRRDHRRHVRDEEDGRSDRVSHTTLLVFEVTILVLAIFLGFEVISKVPAMLHTPLMSGTNAIHGIVIVGAMLVLGLPDKGVFTWIVGFVAVVLASANVVGGFVVTDRMLEMFKRREPPTQS